MFKILLMLFITASSCEAMKIDEIIERANLAAYYAADNGRSDARMIIVDNKGNQQMRQFVIYRQDDVIDGGNQKFLVVFSRPSDVRGTVFLVHKKAQEDKDLDDDRWLYLPALDLEKRISASDNRTSFVGADFYYEDVSGRHPTADQHQLIDETDEFYVIKSIPKEPSTVEFVSYQMQIDKTSYLPMSIEYLDDQGEIYRRVEVIEAAEIQGHPTVMKSKVSNLKTNGYTLLEFRRPSYDIEMNEDLFTLRSLRNPPKK